MQSRVHAYLNFPGTARAAMEFYHSIFGGQLNVSTFKEFGMAQDPSDEDKIMHSVLEADNDISFMGSDVPSYMPQPQATTTLALSGDNKEELSGYFDKLADGGTIQQPLLESPWGDTFGMLTDKFGVDWMVNILAPRA